MIFQTCTYENPLRTSPFYRFKKACTKNIHSLFFMKQVAKLTRDNAKRRWTEQCGYSGYSCSWLGGWHRGNPTYTIYMTKSSSWEGL